MGVHIEIAELDEMREQESAGGGARVTPTRVTDGLGKRPLPVTVALRLLVRFRTEADADVSIATDLLSHAGETIFAREDSTRVPSNGQAHLAIDIPVTLAEPGPYTLHCSIDGTPWSQIISLNRA